MPDNSTEDQEVKFNLGLALLERINEMFYIYNSHMIKGELMSASEMLYLIYDEIDFVLSEEEREEMKEAEEQITRVMSETNIDQKHSADNGKRIYFTHPNERETIKSMLREYIREIKRYMKAKGMLMPERGEEGLF